MATPGIRQGETPASEEDIQAYMAEVRAEAKDARPEDLAAYESDLRKELIGGEGGFLGTDTVQAIPALATAAARAPEYPFGIHRVAVAQQPVASTAALDPATAQAIEEVRGPSGLARPGDWERALTGQAPGGGELLGRAGVPEGPSVELGPVKFSARDVAGLTLEAGAELPLALLSASGKLGSVAKRALAPISGAVEKGGKNLYRSGFKNLDMIAKAYGKKPVSDVAIELGWVRGSSDQIWDQLSQGARRLGDERVKLGELADQGGARVSPSAVTAPARKEVATLRHAGKITEEEAGALKSWISDQTMDQRKLAQTKIATVGPLPDVFDPDLMQYVARKEPVTKDIPIHQAIGWKEAVGADVGPEAYRMARSTESGKKVEKALHYGLRREIAQQADKVKPGLGEAINDVNENVSSLLTVRGALEQMAKSEVKRNTGTPVDAMILGGTAAISGSPLLGLGALGLKKVADIAKTSAARTKGGYWMKQIGRSGAPDIAARRGLSVYGRKDEEKK
jgi:hypothetical protein